MAPAKTPRSRFWTPGCEAAPVPNGTLTNHDKPVTLRPRKPKPTKEYRKKLKEAEKSPKTRQATGKGLEWSGAEEMVHTACFEPLWLEHEAQEERYAPMRVSRPGPKRKYHEIDILMLVVAPKAMSLSQTKAIRALNDPWMWNRMKQEVKDAWPNHPNRRLAEEAPTECQFYDYIRVYWDEQNADEREGRLEKVCLEAWNDMGGFDSDRPETSITNPDKTQTATGDGSWSGARYQATPEQRDEAAKWGLTLRCEDDADPYHDPDTHKTQRGRNIVMSSVHSGHRQERVVVSFCLGDRNETDATTFTRMVEEYVTKYPHLTRGLRTATYDMAMDSEDADDLLRLGIVPMSKLSRTSKGRASANLGMHTFKLASHTKKNPQLAQIRLLAYDGPPVMEIVDANGCVHLEPLERTKTQINGEAGRHTVYCSYRVRDSGIVPAHLVGATTRVRLNSKPAEKNAKPHRRRTLALRAINEFDPAFDKLFGLRVDSESTFSDYKRHFLNGRLRVMGDLGTRRDLAAFQISTLVTALVAHHRRTGKSLKGWFGDHPPSYMGDPTY